MMHGRIFGKVGGALFWLALAVAAAGADGSVRINEVVASNATTLADDDGDYEDWIELHNTGDEAVDLSGWGLSDRFANLFKWTFPEGAVLWPDDYLVVWASGKDRVGEGEQPVGIARLGSHWQYWTGTSPPPPEWKHESEPSGHWESGPAPLRFGTPQAGTGTTVEHFPDDPPGVWHLRMVFDAAHTDSLRALRAQTVSDAKFELFLNGVRIDATSLPSEGLALHLAADGAMDLREDEGAFHVERWRDLSGRERHASQALHEQQPTWIEEGGAGHPVVRFDGVADFLVTPAFPSGNDTTVFVVARVIGGSGHWSRLFSKVGPSGGIAVQRRAGNPQYETRLDSSGGANQTRPGGSLYDGIFRQFSVVVEDDMVRTFLDGVPDIEGPFNRGNGIGNDSPFFIAAHNDHSGIVTKADVAEILFYERALNDEERKSVERYLAAKYGVGTPKPDYALPPELLQEGENILAATVEPVHAEPPQWTFDASLDAVAKRPVIHTNFSIAAAGEEVVLTRPDGSLADALPPTRMRRDYSIGRVPGEGDKWYIFPEPTPGVRNDSTTATRFLPPPVLSQAPGFYETELPLSATHPHGDVTLRYTTDGSVPTADSPAFPSPLHLLPRSGEPNVVSAIRTTVANHFWRAPPAPVAKANTLRVRAFADDGVASFPLTASYFVGPEVAGRYTLPVLSVVTEQENFFGHDDGIYVGGAGYDGSNYNTAHYFRRGREWERPVHVELFAEDGSTALAQDAGARIHGGLTRRWAVKSLRFYARRDYGDNTFDARLFPTQSDAEYKRFIIRNSGNDHNDSFFRDAFMQRLVGHMRFDTQAYQPTIVFINGEYWGIQNMRERYDRHYLARTYGVDPDNVDILELNRRVKYGSASHYNNMLQYIDTHGVVDAERFEQVRQWMDTDNFVDYNVAHIFLNNWDWPGNNIEYWRLRTDRYVEGAPYGHDGRWRWMLYDTDFGFWLYHAARDRPDHDMMAFATRPDGPGWPNPPWSTFLLRRLLENEVFRHQFINRFADQLNTAFRSERALALIDEMQAVIAPEIEEHIERWEIPPSTGHWTASIERMRQFAIQRPAYVREHIRTHFGLPGTAALTVHTSHPGGGRIRVNSIVLDDSSPGVSPVDGEGFLPWTGVYFQSVPVQLAAESMTGYRFAGWAVHAADAPGQPTGPASVVSEDPTLILELTSGMAVVANFEKNDPPIAVDSIGRRDVRAGGDVIEINLRDYFIDPEGDPISYSAGTSDPDVAGLDLTEDVLTLWGKKTGEAEVVVEAADGHNPPTVEVFSVLVHPRPWALAAGSYTFSEWAPETPAGQYPGNMVFLQSEEIDPGLQAALTSAYRIPPGDAFHEDDVLFPYAASRRTRINGLGENGISFINTGRPVGRDLGSALLALDTRGVQSVELSWTGGTVTSNDRVYGIRLQYRIGLDGTWKDVVQNGDPVEYTKNPVDGHEEHIGPLLLPKEVGNQPYVQLQWRYFHIAGGSGPRAELRLDNIHVANAELDTTFEDWRKRVFPDPSDQSDPSISGPYADPRNEGVTNLLRYALGLGVDRPAGPLLPEAEWDGNALSLVFYRNPESMDIAYIVQASHDLAEWSEVLYNSMDNPAPNNEGLRMRVVDRETALDEADQRFMRLVIVPTND